jgi:hypothetical protein
MDGGMSDNNPSRLALRELRKMMPGLRRPHQFVSVGTGTCKAKLANASSGMVFSNGSIYQAFQHYMAHHFDGDKEFQEMRHALSMGLPEEANDIDQWFRRFNLPLDATLPDLADAQAMDSLADAAQEHFTSDPAVDDLARAVLASCFYFELLCLPKFENGLYECYGRILCRMPVTAPAFESLMRQINSASAQFVVPHGERVIAAAFDRTGNFNKSISFRIKRLDELVSIRLLLLDTYSYHISTSPFSIESLIKLQKLEWAVLKVTNPRASSSTKRKQQSGELAPPAKRCCRGS